MAFTAIVVGVLIFDAAHSWFWQRAHATAWVAALLLLLFLARLLQRSRFAWWLFVVFGVIGLVAPPIYQAGHHVSVGWIVGALVGVVELGLLVSPPMRRFIGVQGWLAPNRR